MRVTGGRLCGRRLRVPSGNLVRPSTDRLRESLFAHIAHGRGLAGERVLDVFAGTGSLGIEALSRGAAEAVFVERAAPALAVLRENLAGLALTDRARVARGDARSALRRLAGAGERFGLVFLDPPYGSGSLSEALARVPALLAPGGDVWVETGRHDPLPSPAGLAILDARPYGETRVTRWAAEAGVDETRAEPEAGVDETRTETGSSE